MIAAELAGGRHPFELPGGQMMADQQIRAWLAQRPVDLSAVTDRRAALLCRGLLVRDRRDRWGASQVAAWLGGESPAVADDRPAVAPAPRARRVLFAGVELSTPAELAAAFQRQWGEAFRRLFQERDAGLIEETERLLRQHGLDEALRLLAPVGSAAELPRRFATLLGEMDPELDPVFNAVRLTEGGLEAAALEVLQAGGDHPATSVLDEVRRRGVLIAWRSLPGMGHGPRTHEAWVASCGELDKVVAPLRDAGFQPDAADWARARAWLLLCALDPERHTAQLRAALEGLDDSLARERPWWAALRDSAAAEAGAPARLAAALVAQPTATEQAHVAREQARQAEAAAKERQRQEVEERRRQEAEARRARRRQQQQSRARLLLWITLPGTVLLAWTLILILLTYFGEPWMADAPMDDASDLVREFHATWWSTDSGLDVLTWDKSRLGMVSWALGALWVAGLASVTYSDRQGQVSPTAVIGVAAAALGYGAAIVMLPWALELWPLILVAIGAVFVAIYVLSMIC
ncbi:MAG TPA: hypothetical protein VGR26_15680 [Acidimicrobiales bacterium]|nr:hypothetical protein [Acidimicrobiales bacterium]